MNKNEMQTLLKDLTEQKAPASQIDLWPAIQARLPMSQPESSRGTIMKTQSQSQVRQWRPAYLLLAVILIGALFFTLPQGRAMGQAVLRFFQRGDSNLMPGVTVTPVKWVEQTPGVAAATVTPKPIPAGPAFEAVCGSYQAPHCTIEDIRGMVSFPVFALPDLPEDMHFIGATGSPDQAHLFYQTADQTGVLTIWEEPVIGKGDRQTWEVGADAVIEPVQVGPVTAEYVKGSYDGSTNPPVWNSNLNVQVLRWVNQGILINLQMLGTEPRMGRDDLAALAARLTIEGVAAEVTPVPVAAAPTEEAANLAPLYPLTFQEANEQVGWGLLAPARLPEFLIFNGAAVETLPAQPPIITLSYRMNPKWGQPDGNGLLIREQIIPTGDPCRLCGFVVGQYNGTAAASRITIGANATIETVKVGSADGQYVEGVWKGTDQGWVYDPDPYIKSLYWQANGIGFEITYFGMEITQEDMIAIADSMK